jgi:single-strand DNA-binding protein
MSNASANHVTFTGNTTRAPELRFTPSGAAVCNFGLAVNRSWKNQQTNEWEEETTFLDVVCWRQLAENVAESIDKGARVTVIGRLDQRSWETDTGEKRSKIEVVADEVAAALSRATVQVTRNERRDAGGGEYSAPAPTLEDGEEPFHVDAADWWPQVEVGAHPERMLP